MVRCGKGRRLENRQAAQTRQTIERLEDDDPTRQPSVKRPIIILGVATLAIGGLVFSFVDRIPPRALTATRMHVSKRRVLHFALTHGELPKSLTALPAMEGYDNNIRDGWNRELIFEVSASSVITIRSLGRDGATGGSGEDAAIVTSFTARD